MLQACQQLLAPSNVNAANYVQPSYKGRLHNQSHNIEACKLWQTGTGDSPNQGLMELNVLGLLHLFRTCPLQVVEL